MARVRAWVRVLHRDVGYALAGLVTVFCASGVAVNHVDAWNPSYARASSELALGPLPSGDLEQLERETVRRAGVDPREVQGRRLQSPASFQVFLEEGGEISVDPSTGRGTMLRVTRRPLLFEANVLHLNHAKGVWTWVSDAFAILLAGLALSGLFMLKGPTGLAGRGKWFVLGGLAVPVAFVALYYLSL